MHLLRRRSLITASLAVQLIRADTDFSKDVLKYVDPLIGTLNGGHVFPGASLPFGMAKAGADVDSFTDGNQGGFVSDGSRITGFSHMHDSGTGGSSSLGNFPIFPQTGCVDDVLYNCAFSENDRETKAINGSIRAHPGYFALTLDTLIDAEMTVTNHTALYRFTFPPDPTFDHQHQSNMSQSPLIVVDLGNLGKSYLNGSIVVDSKTGRITANGTFGPSFGIGTYDAFFCADFIGAEIRDSGLAGYTNEGFKPLLPSRKSTGYDFPPTVGGAWIQFHRPPNDQILVRVGVSLVSVARACTNANLEIPAFDFNKTLQAAEDAWRRKFSVVQIDATGVSDELQTVFWSGLYRSMLSPQDYTGENPLWKSNEPYYDSYYCIWDSFRSIHPLLILVDPNSQTRMVRSLIDIYRFEGKLPDCRMSLCKGFTQGGSNADVVLADSYLKNISEGVDWETGYAAMISDAEVEPLNWDVEGRGGLASWKTLGYIPFDDDDRLGSGLNTRSVSRTVEYAYDDFCISRVADAMGKPADMVKYLGRSENWKNLYNPNQTSTLDDPSGINIEGIDTGFVGYLQPKMKDGTFTFQDPSFCSPLNGFSSCYLNSNGHETYEGSIWMYTFFVPQDMKGLIGTLGGPQSFIDRLTFLHTSGLLYMGDEQAFLPVFQFHYGGRPGLSASCSHSYIPSQFNTSVAGIPGNDDSGAMGSFAVLSMMGLWPVAGQDVYLITPPYFREVKVTNSQTGKVATITNVNFDTNYKNIYIQSARLNGLNYTKSWVSHSFWLEGGRLELVLGSRESSWGTRDEDLPPSASLDV